jgi:virginiamycin B lyase
MTVGEIKAPFSPVAVGRWALPLVAMAVALGATGCGGSASSTRVAMPTAFRLPDGSEPEQLIRATDGSLWVSEVGGGAVARLLPDGRLRLYRLPGRENGGGSIAEGPDGAIWSSGSAEIFRIEPESGSVAVVAGFGPDGNPDLGSTGALAAGPGESIWYTSEGTPDRIVQLSLGGHVNAFDLAGSKGETMRGIVAAPDGSLWFTLSSLEGPADAIGQLGTEGHFRRRPLPDRRGFPTAIVEAHGGVLWFIEESGERIGRIGLDGQIEEFPLPRGVTPTGITVSGGRVWFCSSHKVGTVSAHGRISEWRVEGASEISDIAPGPRRGVWLADSGADTLRYFRPDGA